MTDPVTAAGKLLENYGNPAWVLDKAQNIVYVNPAMQELFGDLTGQKSYVIYDGGSESVDSAATSETEFESEVVITDVPFRRLSTVVDFGESENGGKEADKSTETGKFRIEYFEDISEQKLIHTNMAQALAKINAEVKVAKTVQNSILPGDDTYWNTFAFSSLYIPADDLGGDFYDLLKLNDDEYLLYMADVSGHGIRTALLTVFMRERVRANTAAAAAGTSELLAKLVRDFCALESEGMMYVTMVLCKYTKSKRELSISNAGHGCFPLIVRDSGRIETIPTRGMPICTLAEDTVYDEEIVSIKPGDRLVLFTDGIVEEVDTTTGRSFGPEGVRELAEKHREYNGSYLARQIMDESNKYALISAKDDRSIVVVDVLS